MKGRGGPAWAARKSTLATRPPGRLGAASWLCCSGCDLVVGWRRPPGGCAGPAGAIARIPALPAARAGRRAGGGHGAPARRGASSALLAQLHLLGNLVHLVHHAVDDACAAEGAVRRSACVSGQERRDREPTGQGGAAGSLTAPSAPATVNTPPMTAQMAVRNL